MKPEYIAVHIHRPVVRLSLSPDVISLKFDGFILNIVLHEVTESDKFIFYSFLVPNGVFENETTLC